MLCHYCEPTVTAFAFPLSVTSAVCFLFMIKESKSPLQWPFAPLRCRHYGRHPVVTPTTTPNRAIVVTGTMVACFPVVTAASAVYYQLSYVVPLPSCLGPCRYLGRLFPDIFASNSKTVCFHHYRYDGRLFLRLPFILRAIICYILTSVRPPTEVFIQQVPDRCFQLFDSLTMVIAGKCMRHDAVTHLS